jgi:AcrR family transcriptional regulator
MTASAEHTRRARTPLNRVRVLEAAVAIADRDGIDAVTMRRVGQDLGVEAMSLYNHVANKEDLLDGMVETVIHEVISGVSTLEPPVTPDDWKQALRARILTAREVLLGHPWAPGVIETRTEMTPILISYFDGVLGLLRAGGMSYDLAHHAMHALGSRAFGFTQELFVPDEGADQDPSAPSTREMAAAFPFIAAMLDEVRHSPDEPSLGWCDDQTEFIFGLDLILDGLDRLRAGMNDSTEHAGTATDE